MAWGGGGREKGGKKEFGAGKGKRMGQEVGGREVWDKTTCNNVQVCHCSAFDFLWSFFVL